MYICKYCEREFEKQQGYASHVCKCKLNPNRDNAMRHLLYARKCIDYSKLKNKKLKKDTTEYYCIYCNKLLIGKNSLSNHERLCKENPNRQISNFIKYNEDCRNNITHHPHKGQTKYTSDSLKRMSETKKKKYENGELQSSFKGHHHSKVSKEKMRISTFKYLNCLKNVKCPRYNKESIMYINKLNEEKGWNLQHAENGGEISVGGYFLDGYDKDLNIVFEYDEAKHYKDIQNNILNDKDIERQQYIIEKLHCEFWRYNKELDLLYKI